MRDTLGSAPSLYRWRFGAAEFDEARLELRVAGLAVDIEQKPLQVLALLLQHAGEVVTKRELFDSVWAGRITVDHVLATAVGKLRKALGEHGESLIATVPRVGYRLGGRVERVAVGQRHVSALHLSAGQPVPGRVHFLLERPLGASRLSEVWLARQPKTREARVFKFSIDGSRLSALKREATLARVLRESLGEREDFVRLIDWNFEEPPFFLECEYGGPNLLEWAGANTDFADFADRPLQQRLDLFLQIADAVADAHSVGILHKDIKPANVLVAEADGAPRIRLTDFGSSRLLEPERLAELGITELGLTMTQGSGGDSTSGTPLYLAPELITGEAPTVRSDVYSLGVLLYQFAVGDFRKPIASGWEQDIADALLREDIARATDGNPARRVATVAALAQSLRALGERHVERERQQNAQARAQAAERALERMHSRRPWVYAATSLLTLGLIVSLGLYAYAARARTFAAEQARRAETINLFMRDLMGSADPGRTDAGPEMTVGAALQSALAHVDERFREAPETAAEIHRFAGEIFEGRGESQEAEKQLRRAAALFESLHDHRQTLITRYALSRTLSNQTRHDEAQSLIRETDAAAADLLESDALLGFERHHAIGRSLLLQLRADEAAPHYQAALQVLEATSPGDVHSAFALRLDLAQCYSRIGRHADAVKLLTGLQEPRFADAGISASRRAVATLYLGAALLYAGRHGEAEPVLQRAVTELAQAYGAESLNVAEARGALGNLYVSTGRVREALPELADVRTRICARRGDEHLACLFALGNESIVRLRLGDASAAIEGLRRTRSAFSDAMGEGSPGVQAMDFYLATALLAQGQPSEAAALAATLSPDALEAGSPGEPWAARLRGLHGVIELQLGQNDKSPLSLRAALEELEAGGQADFYAALLRDAMRKTGKEAVL